MLRVALVRLFTVGLGAAAIAWGIFNFPYFVRKAPLLEVARQIIAETPFRVDVLDKLLADADAAEQDSLCRPRAMRAAAILKLRVLELTYTGDDVALIDPRAKELDEAIRDSLSCAPADAFLWQVMFTVESTRNGFRPEYLEYARMSYRLGPNEGWVALKRCPVLLAVFERLPPDLADNVVDEFGRIVENGLYPDAVRILTGPGWRVRDRLLRRLEHVALSQREQFARLLDEQGFDVTVPGVVLPEHPWRR